MMRERLLRSTKPRPPCGTWNPVTRSRLAPKRDVRAMAGLALARSGDVRGAEMLAAGLDEAFPLDTLVQKYWLPTIRAAVALERKDAGRAVQLLHDASAIERAAPTSTSTILC